MPLIAADADIPFLEGRLDGLARVRLLRQDEFTREAVADADAMMIRTRTRCNRDLLEGSHVGFIATATIGMDQFDLPACRQMGIGVRNAPGCNAPGVAQYVWASLMHAGIDPKEITIGVVGHGNVGTIVAEWGELLGVRVLVNDPPKEEAMRARGENVPANYTDLDTLLRNCDVVTLHTPMTREGAHPTFHLIGGHEMEMMREDAVLINAARGPVIDTEAVKKAIRQKGIKAIIDCWEGEPVIDLELLDLAMTATYHIAGYSLEGKQRATRQALEAIGEHFGFKPDLSGLAAPYTPFRSLDAATVRDSFDPAPVMAELKAAPRQFDTLRAAYTYRPEPKGIR